MPNLHYDARAAITGLKYLAQVPRHLIDDSVTAEPELASYAR